MAEAFAEGRGRAQADTLRSMRRDRRDHARRLPAASELRAATSWWCRGRADPRDGTVIEGIATVDESAITGESAP